MFSFVHPLFLLLFCIVVSCSTHYWKWSIHLQHTDWLFYYTMSIIIISNFFVSMYCVQYFYSHSDFSMVAVCIILIYFISSFWFGPIWICLLYRVWVGYHFLIIQSDNFSFLIWLFTLFTFTLLYSHNIYIYILSHGFLCM